MLFRSRDRGTGRPAAPSEVALPPPSATAGPTAPVPFAWLDDAELIVPGTVWVGFSVMRWQGSGLHEISFPIVTAAAGLSPRMQLMATVPQIARTVNGLNGGLGTSFLGVKVGVLEGREGRGAAGSPRAWRSRSNFCFHVCSSAA